MVRNKLEKQIESAMWKQILAEDMGKPYLAEHFGKIINKLQNQYEEIHGHRYEVVIDDVDGIKSLERRRSWYNNL